MNVLLVAEESAGIQMLKALHESDHNLVAVMASPRKRNGVSVGEQAKRLGYNVWPARDVKDPHCAARIRSVGIDLLLNVHSLYIICESVLEAPRMGSYNIHPGPLPHYAGLNVVSWAIYQGERQHGVSIHRMLPGIDTGPIAYESRFDIAPNETGLSLALKCVRAGVPLLLKLLQQASIDPEGIPQRQQDLLQRQYYGKDIPRSGVLDWTRSAREVDQFVRASDYFPFASPWGIVHTHAGTRQLGVVKTTRTGAATSHHPGTVGIRRGSSVWVACADEWIAVNRVEIDGEIVDATSFLEPGMRLGPGLLEAS